MSVVTVRMTPGSVWSMDMAPANEPVEEVVIMSGQDGLRQVLDGLDGATSIKKGTQPLSMASRKELATDKARPVKVANPPLTLVVSVE